MPLCTRRRLVGAAAVALAAAGAGTGYALYRVKHPALAPLGLSLGADELARARALLARHPAFDVHAHPGRTFVRDAEHLVGLVRVYAALGPFEERTIAEMHEGGLAASAFAAVADFQTLGLVGEGLEAVRNFEPGEALASYARQIGHLQALVQRGLVHPVLDMAHAAADVAAARAAGKVGMLITVEGGDFLEGRAERVAQAFADGVRSITLLHYRSNELGDTLTGRPLHGGLTPAGAAVVAAMNTRGMLIDLAHASQATAYGVLEASRKPVIASHVHLNDLPADGQHPAHPRFIPAALAKAIVGAGGGVIGAWPAGIGIGDLNGFVERTLALVGVLGIDHVCLGSDMDANFKPVFDTYTKLPHYVAALLQRGLSEADIAKLIGGNFLRLLAAQA